MACATCKKSILFGGERAGSRRYCSKKCFKADALGRLGDSIPESRVDEVAKQLRVSLCRSCHRQNDVEIFKSYLVYSVVILTSWREKPALSCRSCARKRQTKDLIASFLLGWWGIPFGLIVTPIIVVMNGLAMTRNPLNAPPSRALRDYARLVAAHELSKVRQEIPSAPKAVC